MNKMIKLNAILLSVCIPAAFAAGKPASMDNVKFTSLQGPQVQLFSTLDGIIVAENVTELKAPAAGKILELEAKASQPVKKGDLIANVFTPQVQKTLERLEKRGKKTPRAQISSLYDLPTVTSPYDGFISELDVKVNSKVKAGQKIGSVAGRVIVRAHNSDKMFVTPQNGMQVLFYGENNQVTMHGYVESFSYTNKEGFYNFDIALVDDGTVPFIPGTKVKGKILSYESSNSSKVRNDAIIHKDGKTYLLTANEVIINASDSEYSEVLQIESGYEYLIPSSLKEQPKAAEAKKAPAKTRALKRSKPKRTGNAAAPAQQQAVNNLASDAAMSMYDDALSIPSAEQNPQPEPEQQAPVQQPAGI